MRKQFQPFVQGERVNTKGRTSPSALMLSKKHQILWKGPWLETKRLERRPEWLGASDQKRRGCLGLTHQTLMNPYGVPAPCLFSSCCLFILSRRLQLLPDWFPCLLSPPHPPLPKAEAKTEANLTAIRSSKVERVLALFLARPHTRKIV